MGSIPLAKLGCSPAVDWITQPALILTMIPESAPPIDFAATLEQAALYFTTLHLMDSDNRVTPMPTAPSTRPTPTAMVEALLAAEKAAKQQRLSLGFESLLGKWRLCFATGTRKVRQRGGIVLSKGYYWFKFLPASITFADEDDLGKISNQIELGTFSLKFLGSCRYLGKKNLLAFDFAEFQLTAFGKTLYHSAMRSAKTSEPFANRAIATLPFFAFFCATPNYIAARGRGGGLALWVRQKSTQEHNLN